MGLGFRLKTAPDWNAKKFSFKANVRKITQSHFGPFFPATAMMIRTPASRGGLKRLKVIAPDFAASDIGDAWIEQMIGSMHVNTKAGFGRLLMAPTAGQYKMSMDLGHDPFEN